MLIELVVKSPEGDPKPGEQSKLITPLSGTARAQR
jgi:hypothetical protein